MYTHLPFVHIMFLISKKPSPKLVGICGVVYVDPRKVLDRSDCSEINIVIPLNPFALNPTSQNVWLSYHLRNLNQSYIA